MNKRESDGRRKRVREREREGEAKTVRERGRERLKKRESVLERKIDRKIIKSMTQ